MALDRGKVTFLLTLGDVGSNQRMVQHTVSDGGAARGGIHPRHTRDPATIGTAALSSVCVAIRVSFAALDADTRCLSIIVFEVGTHEGHLEEEVAHGIDAGMAAAVGTAHLTGLTLGVIRAVLRTHPGHVLRGWGRAGEELHTCVCMCVCVGGEGGGVVRDSQLLGVHKYV